MITLVSNPVSIRRIKLGLEHYQRHQDRPSRGFGCWRLACTTVLGLLGSKKQHFEVLRAHGSLPSKKTSATRVIMGFYIFICTVDPVRAFLESEKATNWRK